MLYSIRDEINGYVVERIQIESNNILYTLRSTEPVSFEQIDPFTKVPYRREYYDVVTMSQAQLEKFATKGNQNA
jgi:hypothetical protein